MGRIADYADFLKGLTEVWERCSNALVPGGRLACVFGDMCLSRRSNGGHHMVVRFTRPFRRSAAILDSTTWRQSSGTRSAMLQGRRGKEAREHNRLLKSRLGQAK